MKRLTDGEIALILDIAVNEKKSMLAARIDVAQAQLAQDKAECQARIEKLFREIEDKLASKDYTGRKRNVSFVLECDPWQMFKQKWLAPKPKMHNLKKTT